MGLHPCMHPTSFPSTIHQRIHPSIYPPHTRLLTAIKNSVHVLAYVSQNSMGASFPDTAIFAAISCRSTLADSNAASGRVKCRRAVITLFDASRLPHLHTPPNVWAAPGVLQPVLFRTATGQAMPSRKVWQMPLKVAQTSMPVLPIAAEGPGPVLVVLRTTVVAWSFLLMR